MSVTVLMTTYNRRNYVGAAIESVLSQQHADFEFIIVDDASTDDTPDLLRMYARQDKRITVARQPTNGGPAAARNKGLKLANHELVAQIDDDDLMLPSRIKRQIQFMHANPAITVGSSWAHLIDAAGRVVGKSCPKVDLDVGRERKRPEFFLEIIHPSVMYRRSHIMAVGGYRDTKLEDRDLWGRLVTAGYRLAVQPEILIHHRRHGGSLMTSQSDSLFEFGDYIDYNVIRRLRGQDEISFMQYRDHMGSLPLVKRIFAKQRRKSGLAFRRATIFYAERQWLALIAYLGIAVTLDPVETIRRMHEKARR